MNILFEREDGYTEYEYKAFLISYFQGEYEITDWFRDNIFKSEEAVKNAIESYVNG